MLVSTSAIENLANEPKDIDCSDYDTGAGNNRPRTVEDIHMLECTVEDGHFGNETAESRKSEVSKSGNYIAARKGIIFIKPESSRTSRV